MRKTVVATLLVASIALAGCQSNKDGNIEPNPAPVPSASETKSEKPSEPSNEPTETREPQPTRTTENPEPSPAATTSEAGTPATQFAKRWGERYPAVPEYAILKAANGVCAVATQFPDWTTNPLAKAGIDEVVKGFGIDENDGVEFTQDAQQNYCSSIENPT